eukprot:3848333-Rhodomonas_salina.2
MMTHRGELCDAHGRVGRLEFYLIMRSQLRAHVFRKLASSSEVAARYDAHTSLIMSVLKNLMLAVDEVTSRLKFDQRELHLHGDASDPMSTAHSAGAFSRRQSAHSSHSTTFQHNKSYRELQSLKHQALQPRGAFSGFASSLHHDRSPDGSRIWSRQSPSPTASPMGRAAAVTLTEGARKVPDGEADSVTFGRKGSGREMEDGADQLGRVDSGGPGRAKVRLEGPPTIADVTEAGKTSARSAGECAGGSEEVGARLRGIEGGLQRLEAQLTVLLRVQVRAVRVLPLPWDPILLLRPYAMRMLPVRAWLSGSC